MSTSPQPSVSPEPATPARRKTYRWFPIGAVVLCLLAIVVVQSIELAERIPPAEAQLTRLSLAALGGILVFLWFIGFGPASRGVRRGMGIAGLVAVLGLLGLFRIEGVSGDVMPHLRFRWQPRPDQQLPNAAKASDASETVDLTATGPTDSPEFMGPGRLAKFDRVKLARDWSAQPPKQLWRQPIGAGWSSFAVVGNYAVTQEQRGDEELVTCYNLNTGKLVWAHATPVRFHEVIAGIGPRATPTIHQGRVYAMGAMGHLHCLEGATGKQIWQHNVVEETKAPFPQWGKSCSPLVHENLVIVSAGGPDGKSLAAYDQLDGHLVWSAGDDLSSYSSPTLMTLCGVPQVVIVNENFTSGHDPADGRMLWQHAWPENAVASPNVAQPIAVGNDRLLLSKGYTVGATLWQLAREGDRWTVTQLWKNNYLKTKMTSPVVRDGYAYGLDESILTCIEIDSGRRMWKRGKFGHGQVLLVGDLLLVQSETGEVALVEASPDDYLELTRFTAVGGQSWNYPTLSGNRLLVRSEQEAACYELPVVSDEAPPAAE